MTARVDINGFRLASISTFYRPIIGGACVRLLPKQTASSLPDSHAFRGRAGSSLSRRRRILGSDRDSLEDRDLVTIFPLSERSTQWYEQTAIMQPAYCGLACDAIEMDQ